MSRFLKSLFKNLGAKKTAELVTSKPVREVGKKIIKHELKSGSSDGGKFSCATLF